MHFRHTYTIFIITVSLPFQWLEAMFACLSLPLFSPLAVRAYCMAWYCECMLLQCVIYQKGNNIPFLSHLVLKCCGVHTRSIVSVCSYSVCFGWYFLLEKRQVTVCDSKKILEYQV